MAEDRALGISGVLRETRREVRTGDRRVVPGVGEEEEARIHRRTVQKINLHDPDNHDGVITHLEPDILEYEVKWALERITTNKASGGDRIPVEIFQILKDDAVKVLHSICQEIWKTHQGPQDWKRSVFIPIPKKGNAKECSNYHTIALISHTSRAMLKILQAQASAIREP